MKTITIAFVDFWTGFDKEGFICTQILRSHYDVKIVPNPMDADYVFFSVMGEEHWSLSSKSIKIFYTGENICPDFNACDFAIGFEHISFGDRYFRLPNYYATPFYRNQWSLFAKRYQESISESTWYDLAKREFCSFVVSNGGGNSIRKQLFDNLSLYKQVNSGGRWMNNVGGPVDDKIGFESKHKFSICCENSSHSGYTTEKIIEAFAARVIPIYWGDPDIDKVFNSKAFINVRAYPSIESVVEHIIKLDQDDDAYIAMLQEPALLHPEECSMEVITEQLSIFIQNIVDRPLDEAQRYNREYWGERYHEREKQLILKSKRTLKEMFRERFLR